MLLQNSYVDALIRSLMLYDVPWEVLRLCYEPMIGLVSLKNKK